MLFQEILLGFFVYENLLGRCDLKIAVVEFVYPFFFFKKLYYRLGQIILSRFLSS